MSAVPEVIAYEKAVRERKMLEELLAAALEREEAARKAAERKR
jgi:hypothetical protein